MSKKKNCKNGAREELEARLDTYSVAARSKLTVASARRGQLPWMKYSAAVTAATMIGASGEAAVVPIPNPGISVPIKIGPGSGYYTDVNIDSYGLNDFRLSVKYLDTDGPGKYLTNLVQLDGLGNAAFVEAATYGYAKKLVTSDSVSAGASPVLSPDLFKEVVNTVAMTVSTLGEFPGFAAGGTGVVGIKFNRSGQDHFGWIRLAIGPSSVTITEMAYESVPGAAIHVPAAAGAVPEPSTFAMGAVGLLAAGASGLRKYRRRRREEAIVTDTASDDPAVAV